MNIKALCVVIIHVKLKTLVARLNKWQYETLVIKALGKIEERKQTKPRLSKESSRLSSIRIKQNLSRLIFIRR